MKKSELIALLNSIKGNPEVKLWNGMVGDWVDIEKKVYPLALVKQTEADYLECIRLEKCVDTQNWEYHLPPESVDRLKKLYKKVCTWDDNAYVSEKAIASGRYKTKTVYALQAKSKGVSTWDRLGTICY